MIDSRFQHASWHKSTYSGGGQACIETATAAGVVGVRDTKNRDAGTVTVSRPAWTAFINSVTAR